MATELLRKHKLTWAEVIGVETGPVEREPPPPRPRSPAPWAPYLDEIPTPAFSTARLRRYAKAFLDEHEEGRLDFGDTNFIKSVLTQRRWSPRQREGLVRTLRRAWMIRYHHGNHG